MNFLITKLIYHGLHLQIKMKRERSKKKYVASFFLKIFRSIASFKLYFPSLNRVENVFYVGTENQNLVLYKMYNRIRRRQLVYYHGADVSLDFSASKKYPFWIAFLFSAFSYPFTYKLRKSIRKKIHPINPNIDFDYEISLLVGFYFLNIIILKLSSPKYVWLSNDHMNNNVSLIYAAKKLKIRTIYIQHASVSDIFPPLNFDIAFLDGNIAYSIYKKIGITGTRIFLTGNPKLDGYINRYKNGKRIYRVMICMNGTDNPLKFENLIDLMLGMDIKIKLRKHPYLNICLKNEDSVEKSNETEFPDALEGVDLVVAGDSNVHLEATLCNIPSMYISSSVIFDYYGFSKNNLVVWSGECENECAKKIEGYSGQYDVYRRAKPYYESIDTDFENRSTEKILSLLGYD